MEFGGDYTLQKGKGILILISSIIVGILIMLSPIIITGSTYNVTSVQGDLLVADFSIRVIVIVIGLIVIYDGIKNFCKKNL
ncbi:putative integral membrane protein [Paenibacillus anaericanus]|nr:putative integral membrane protein [Paenibacillus anaericanus]